jgi:hypothetical protein
VIAESDAWTLIHIVIIVGIICMLGGLVAVRHSITGGVAEALARLGVYAATIGVTIGVVTVILDGVAAKQLADQWAAAAGRLDAAWCTPWAAIYNGAVALRRPRAD